MGTFCGHPSWLTFVDAHCWHMSLSKGAKLSKIQSCPLAWPALAFTHKAMLGLCPVVFFEHICAVSRHCGIANSVRILHTCRVCSDPRDAEGDFIEFLNKHDVLVGPICSDYWHCNGFCKFSSIVFRTAEKLNDQPCHFSKRVC